MNLAGTFYNVSGIDSNDGAKIVFVWCRDPQKSSDDPDGNLLLGSGHVVDADTPRPPGIAIGQFRVTFPLPPGCSADDIVVTDDKAGKAYLPGVKVTPCTSIAAVKSGGTITPGEPAEHVGATNDFTQPSQLMMARKRG